MVSARTTSAAASRSSWPPSAVRYRSIRAAQDLVGQLVGGAQDDAHAASWPEQGVIGGQRRENFLQAHGRGHMHAGRLGRREQARQQVGRRLLQ